MDKFLTNKERPEMRGETSPILKSHNSHRDIQIQSELQEIAESVLKPELIYLAILIKKVKYDINELYNFFSKLSYVRMFLLCQEEEKTVGIHYHVFMGLANEYVLGSQFRSLKSEWKERMPQLNEKFALQVSKVAKFEYVSYCLKDGVYQVYNMPQKLIEYMKELSYPKYSKDKFAKEWDEIFYNKNYGIRQKVEQYILLKQKYRQKITTRQVDDIILNVRLQQPGEVPKFLDARLQYVDQSFQKFDY